MGGTIQPTMPLQDIPSPFTLVLLLNFSSPCMCCPSLFLPTCAHHCANLVYPSSMSSDNTLCVNPPQRGGTTTLFLSRTLRQVLILPAKELPVSQVSPLCQPGESQNLTETGKSSRKLGACFPPAIETSQWLLSEASKVSQKEEKVQDPRGKSCSIYLLIIRWER